MAIGRLTPKNVSAVVCTMNSISGIERCLTSLRESGVGQIIVVDASSTDGTREIAEQFADLILTDPGTGLGNARNVGIAQTSGEFILNMGSDNIAPPGQIALMLETLISEGYSGVSARTRIAGSDYLSRGLNAWRQGRFRPGPAAVIGTPTLFRGEVLRAHPYDPRRTFSDDSELCERWAHEFGATFAISNAEFFEVGKTTCAEIVTRCRMYGISDEEVFRLGRESGWNKSRQLNSITHPLRVDFVTPLLNLPASQAMESAPFLATFTALRYRFWIEKALTRAKTN